MWRRSAVGSPGGASAQRGYTGNWLSCRCTIIVGCLTPADGGQCHGPRPSVDRRRQTVAATHARAGRRPERLCVALERSAPVLRTAIAPPVWGLRPAVLRPAHWLSTVPPPYWRGPCALRSSQACLAPVQLSEDLRRAVLAPPAAPVICLTVLITPPPQRELHMTPAQDCTAPCGRIRGRCRCGSYGRSVGCGPP
jgi:hypothetical protein